ncbi:hypothetical protein N9W75_02350 [Porticoccaceae bacterium]|nr:hypothetical protein [Porticoccaceae bacterium]MDB2486915.1 hypothetical protein [Porticoccaceae bacterium]
MVFNDTIYHIINEQALTYDFKEDLATNAEFHDSAASISWCHIWCSNIALVHQRLCYDVRAVSILDESGTI